MKIWIYAFSRGDGPAPRIIISPGTIFLKRELGSCGGLGFDGGISFKWSWRTKNFLMAILWEAAGFAKFLKNIVTVQV